MATYQAGNAAARRENLTTLDSTAAENIRFIRHTIEASQTFTMIPGRGCIAMGVLALLAVALESLEPLAAYWLQMWLITALLAGSAALGFMEHKARSQGLSLRRAVARKFFMTLVPAFAVGFVLTLALAGSVPRETISGIWLLCYGAGLVATGVYSVSAVMVAGFSFMVLGTLALALPQGTAIWMLAAGFGGIHVLLGVYVMRYHGG